MRCYIKDCEGKVSVVVYDDGNNLAAVFCSMHGLEALNHDNNADLRAKAISLLRRAK